MAMRRPGHRRPRGTRARAARALVASPWVHGRGTGRGPAHRTARHLADARRQGPGRPRRPRRDGRGRLIVARLQLRELCGFRAGDKGDIADIALFADDDATYELIVREVTAERVKEHFGSMVTGQVRRYEARNVLALNFVLEGALAGGGPNSLRADSLGKTLGGSLVRLEIEVPEDLADRRRARPDVSWADDILEGLPQR